MVTTVSKLDIVFNMGEFAGKSDGVFEADMAAILSPLSGKVSKIAALEWKAIGDIWQKGYTVGRGCEADSARRAWNEATRAFTKPLSPEAAAKAVQRAKAPSKGVTVHSTAKTPKVAAVSAAAAVGRENACIALLHGLTESQLIKIQGVLLEMQESNGVAEALM